jgi:hypothetical protein
MGGWNGKEDAWYGRGNNRVSLGREIWGEGTAEKESINKNMNNVR